MEGKDWLYGAGILVTFLLGMWNLVQGHRASQRASFINTVTAQRVLWLERVRQDISRFVGLTHSWTRTDEDDAKRRAELLSEIDQLRYLIRLRLNPRDVPDQKIMELVKLIPNLTDESDREELFEALERLNDAAQDMLKAEWEKVKEESKKGDLHADREK